jgi:hypothetical protein
MAIATSGKPMTTDVGGVAISEYDGSPTAAPTNAVPAS